MGIGQHHDGFRGGSRLFLRPPRLLLLLFDPVRNDRRDAPEPDHRSDERAGGREHLNGQDDQGPALLQSQRVPVFPFRPRRGSGAATGGTG